jgi:hypothetical protein
MSFFKKCDKRYDWYAYVRIGIYFVLKNGQRYNLCDVHIGEVPGELFTKGVYSGPKDGVRDVRRLGRTAQEIQKYDDEFIHTPPGKESYGVHSTLDVREGGWAQPVLSPNRKKLDIWLFGPVQFSGSAYGSLVIELNGFEMPTHKTELHPIDKKTGQPRELGDPQRSRFKIKFPRSYGLKYLPAKIWGSSYSDGRNPRPTNMSITPLPLLDALDGARSECWPAVLNPLVARVEWKVEEHAGELTECELYERKG